MLNRAADELLRLPTLVEGTAGLNPWTASDAHPGAWVHTSAERWDYCLNVLPPINFRGGFAVSEASRHDDRGVAVYLCLTTIAGKHYAKNATIQEASREALALGGLFAWV